MLSPVAFLPLLSWAKTKRAKLRNKIVLNMLRAGDALTQQCVHERCERRQMGRNQIAGLCLASLYCILKVVGPPEKTTASRKKPDFLCVLTR